VPRPVAGALLCARSKTWLGALSKISLAELRHVDSDLSALKGTVQRIVKVGALASAGKDSDFAALPGVDTLEVSLAAVRNT
jgi:hypothetical protein